MLKNTIISVFILSLVLSLSCDKDITQPKVEPPGKQYDIHWSSLANSPWPIGSQNPQATGRSKYIAAPTGQILKYFPSRRVTSAVVIGSDGTIFTNSLDGGIYAVNPDGTLIWRYMPTERVRTAALNIGLDGTLYFTSLNGTLLTYSEYNCI
jgi:outer membrane protein assembly factor BamB